MEFGNRKVIYCRECEFRKMYDYGRKIYYCDNKNRIDDMGKIGTEDIPEVNPAWCPLSNAHHLVVVENSK